uniref:Cystatin domain-containing protein n=1 Tax=Strongyloides papillosus TaxID=174720 RepID=A0A0N5B729_STREA
MDYFKLVVFVAVTVLLNIEASYVKDYYALGNGWKYKDTKRPTIVKLAGESVNAFNQEHGTNYKLENVDSARKRREREPHYKLSILAKTNCGKLNTPCTKHLLSDVYGNPKSGNKLKISVEEDQNYYPYHLNVF